MATSGKFDYIDDSTPLCFLHSYSRWWGEGLILFYFDTTSLPVFANPPHRLDKNMDIRDFTLLTPGLRNKG